MESSEHLLYLDLTRVDGPRRMRIITTARNAGGVVLNEDIAPLLDNAPPEPKRALSRGLEVELSTRAPFSLLLFTGDDSATHLDPAYKQQLLELGRRRNFKDLAVVAALRELSIWFTRSFCGRPKAHESMNTVPHEGRIPAVTFSVPGEVTAERLQAHLNVGEIGAAAILAVLVEASKGGSIVAAPM